MKICILSRNKKLYSTRRLIEAGQSRGHEVMVLDVLRCYMNITSMRPTIHYRGEVMSGFEYSAAAAMVQAGLLREGWRKSKVLASYCSAMARRVVTLLQQVGIEEKFAITGGIAKNRGVVARLAKELNVEPLTTDMDTQIAGALGGALFAKALYEKKMKKT